jgi:ankyrin repeat protein
VLTSAISILQPASTRTGSGELVSALLDAGAAVDARSACDARTALHHAAERGDAASVAALLRAGASPRQPTRSGLTPRELAARRSDGDGAQVAEMLREAEKRASEELRRLRRQDAAAASRS